MTTTSTRGGKREDAGRKPSVSKRLTVDQRIKAKIELAKQMNVPVLFMPEEAADILGYTNKRQVLNMIASKQIIAINLKKRGEKNNQWRIKYEDLIAFIEKKPKN